MPKPSRSIPSNAGAALPPSPSSTTLHVKYEDMTGRYANHALINITPEECYLDFSSGVVGDKASGGALVLPVHTRIVMTMAGAKRLHRLLGESIEREERRRNGKGGVEAGLPPIKK